MKVERKRYWTTYEEYSIQNFIKYSQQRWTMDILKALADRWRTLVMSQLETVLKLELAKVRGCGTKFQ